MHTDLIGKEVRVSLEPYYGGTARVVEVRPAHEYGKPEKLCPGYITMVVEAVAMTCVSRLLWETSVKPVPVGNKFDMHIYAASFEAQKQRGEFNYSYGV